MTIRGTLVALCVVAVCGCSSSPGPSDLQGSWKAGSGDENGVGLTFPRIQDTILEFQGDRVTYTHPKTGDRQVMTCRLGPKAGEVFPIDLTPTGQDKPMHGIYRFAGDGGLLICWNKEPGGDRPPDACLPGPNLTDFRKKGLVGYYLYRQKR